MKDNESSECIDTNVFEETFVENTTSSGLENLCPGEVVIGVFAGFSSKRTALVRHDGADKPVEAQTTVKLEEGDIGRQVVLMFLSQDINQPVISGLIRNQLDSLLESYEPANSTIEDKADTDIEAFKSENRQEMSFNQKDLASDKDILVDGKSVAIEAQEELIFRCGESSITLTKSGKIFIRGKYLVNRASGVNRILGGSVQIN